tara:strand:+ start:102 stop:2849 length:2748 start_codon:yes stop_codon:yes gene_type:complete
MGCEMKYKTQLFTRVIVYLLLLSGVTFSQSQQEADKLYEEGMANLDQRQGNDALEKFEEALRVYRLLNENEGIKNTLHKIGLIYGRDFGNWKKAEIYWMESLEKAVITDDSTMAAKLRKNLGVVYDRMGKYKKSAEYQKQALNFYERTGNTLKTVQTLKNLGMLYFTQSDYYNAEQQFKRAVYLSKKYGYEKELGRVTLNLGLLNYRTGNYGKSFELFTESEDILGDDLNLIDKINLLINLGMIHRVYGDTLKARIHYDKAMTIATDLGNQGNKAKIYNNMGGLSFDNNDFPEAINQFKKSLEVNEEINAKLSAVKNLKNIGLSYQSLKDYEKADEYLQKAKKISDELGYLWQEGDIELNLGNLETLKGNYKKSIDHYERGLELAHRLDAADLQYRLYAAKGNFYKLRGKLDLASLNYDQSIEIIESIRSGIGLEANRSKFMENVLPIYQKMIDLQVEFGTIDVAYEYYEKMKVRNLLDILEGSFLVFEEEMTEEEIQTQQELESSLRVINGDINNFILAEDNTMRSLDSLVVRQRSVREELQQFQERLYLNHPEISDKVGSGTPIRFKNAIKLLNTDEAAIAYMSMEDEVVCFVLRRLGRRDFTVDSYRIDLSRDELKRMTRKLLRRFRNEDLENFYDLLVAPLKESLEGVNQVCLILDGYLHAIPFQALVDKTTDQHLIEQYSVYYVYSLSVLDELRGYGTAGKEKVLAFGNPEFGTDSDQVATMHGVYKSLPASEDEVKSIGTIYGDRAKVLTNADATETAFKNGAEDFGIIHFATHGMLDEVVPLYSSLLMAPDGENDGFLSAWEIIKIQMDADLVILSACETAKGQLSRGEGMLGLSRAFFGAAVPTLVATLWSVEDVATKLFMEEFYTQIRDGVRVSDALRSAQITLLNNPKYTNPYFWAPFVLFGDSE